MPDINFTAPPTVARFMADEEHFFRLIAGPVGSGKTTGCIFELLRRAFAQTPGPDGLRRTRFAIVRQTLEQLRMTVLKDIEFWLAPIVRYKVSDKTIYIDVDDVRSEWLLIPLEDPEDQRRLLSSQLTGAWMSEAIEMNVDLLDALSGRCGRYPNIASGGCSWYGVIADTNMPTEQSPWYLKMEVARPKTWGVYIQPGGLDPDAENLENLPPGYYERAAASSNEDWVKRYVHAQYGNDPSGSAVFRSSFRRDFHTAESVEPVSSHPIIVAQDFGRNPCAIIAQLDHRGRVLVLDEVVSEDVGLELHLQRSLKPLLFSERYLGKTIYVVGDPAGRQRSTSYEETSFDLLKREGLTAYPAPTNDIDKRLRAVESYLLQQRDGGPALLIDRSRCPRLVEALNGAYRYQRKKSGQLHPLPEKTHPASDLADALQYACLVAHGGLSTYIANRLHAQKYPRVREKISPRAWT